jgi:anti-sigma factor RsiW
VSHLAERISDLVDGRLSAEATDQAHAHLAGCRACRDILEAERLTKARLQTLAAPEPGTDLLTRLLAVAPQSAELAAEVPTVPSGGLAGSRRPGGVGRPAAAPSTTRPSSMRRPRRVRLAAAVAGSFGAFGAGLLALSVFSPTANAAVVPTLDMLSARNVVGMSGLPILNIAPAWRMANNLAGR